MKRIKYSKSFQDLAVSKVTNSYDAMEEKLCELGTSTSKTHERFLQLGRNSRTS